MSNETNYAEVNKRFLDAITPESKSMILEAMADYYEKSPQEMYDEVTSADAEGLIPEYMVEPERMAALALMKKHGFWPA